jgi:cell division protein FtsB
MKNQNKVSFNFMLLNFIAIFVITYFIYHSFIGNRGYIEMRRLNAEIAHKKGVLKKYAQKREYLENRISMLYHKSIDKDLLDEIAREYFGLIGDGEVCIINYTEQKKSNVE